MWDDQEASDKRRPLFGFRISWRCVRCTSWRHYIIDANGDVASRGYDYVAGYQYARGETVPSKAEFRVMLLREQAAERRRARKAPSTKASKSRHKRRVRA